MPGAPSCWLSRPASAPPSASGDEVGQANGPADPLAVAAAIAATLRPPEAADSPPDWLRPSQSRSFRRLVAAVRRFGGALLADPVGTGKTFVALAVAVAVADGAPIEIIAPAILVPEWKRVTGCLGIHARLSSHERVSRGDAGAGVGPVIIDESHRFRVASTRRYRVLAPALIGRPVILVTATPVVNRLDDLLEQLRLVVGDDALRTLGVPSLRGALRSVPPPALSALVIREIRDRPVPQRRASAGSDWLVGSTDGMRSLAAIDRLRLSRDPGVAALLRTSLLRALASSPAALAATVRRYRLLLDHARAARRAGLRVSRRDVEREVGALADQLVLWELLPDPSAPAELALTDLPTLSRLARRLGPEQKFEDAKLDLLRGQLAPGEPTVLFSGFVDTIGYLSRRLELPDIAWITGTRAGIGRLRYPRWLVLEAFGPAPPTRPGPWRRAPWLLLTTDVAAEGLNLQRAQTVIHYDLPWTAVRVEQRDGRAARMGSVHPEVRVVRFDPPAAIDARIALTERLAKKARMPALVGLGSDLDGAWIRHRRIAAAWQGSPMVPGIAIASGRPGAIMAAIAEGLDLVPVPIVASLDGPGGWSEDIEGVERRLEWIRSAPVEHRPPGLPRGLLQGYLTSARELVEQRVRALEADRLVAAGSPAVCRARAQLGRRLVGARRARDAAETARLESIAAALSGGLTAGLEQLAAAFSIGSAEAEGRLAILGGAARPASGPVSVRLIGLIVFVDHGAAGVESAASCR